jgi:hypothetical protein
LLSYPIHVSQRARQAIGRPFAAHNFPYRWSWLLLSRVLVMLSSAQTRKLLPFLPRWPFSTLHIPSTLSYESYHHILVIRISDDSNLHFTSVPESNLLPLSCASPNNSGSRPGKTCVSASGRRLLATPSFSLLTCPLAVDSQTSFLQDPSFKHLHNTSPVNSYSDGTPTATTHPLCAYQN